MWQVSVLAGRRVHHKSDSSAERVESSCPFIAYRGLESPFRSNTSASSTKEPRPRRSAAHRKAVVYVGVCLAPRKALKHERFST